MVNAALSIRNFEKKDVAPVLALAASLTVSRFSTKHGFVEYPLPTKKELAEKVVGNKYSFVATVHDEAIGFLTAYGDDQVLRFEEPDVIAMKILEQRRPFVYADQLGVARPYQRQGLGEHLFERLCAVMAENKINYLYCGVAHAPLKNIPAVTLMKKLDMRLLTEVVDESGLTFGIYSKLLA
ncbi:MAG: hypothetical protein A2542_03625 [Parcubacteria group bacterium RIFOXYD2_FULL_52_8]|nr:MAG: hypothetical protein A2542_03625 [Parcubacteria group bacterium RIFOXYD2_FULL_52_8]